MQFIPYNIHEAYKPKTVRLDDVEADNLKMAKVVTIHKTNFNNRKSRLRSIGRG